MSDRNPNDREDAGDAAGDRALDELIAGARWPEPSPESEGRLRAAWLDVCDHRRRAGRRRRLWWGVSAAAAVAAAAALILVAVTLQSQRDAGPTVADGTGVAEEPQEPREPREPRDTQPVPQPPVTSQDGGREAGPRRAVVSWRPAKPWEAALVRPRSPRPVVATRPHAPSRPNSLIARVDEAVRAVASGDADPAALANQLCKDFPADRVEQRLTPIVVGGGSGPRRRAAVRLLARVATPRSAPLLASLASDPSVRADAVAGLIRVGDVPTLAAMAATAADEAERRRLLAALLDREPSRAVPAYLAFLSEAETAGAALAALDDARSPPVDALFARLNDPRRANRLAAARALGRIDGPVVTARLAAMARRNVNRHEALVALASSDGPEAKAFFDWAMSSKELGAAARTARLGLDHL